MLNFDYRTLEKFVKENSEFLIGARIQKIQQPNRLELLFTMRNNGETRKFYININPQFFHVCFMNRENEGKRYLSIPQKPPMFCMLLRKYLESSRIAKVSQPEGERILEFYFRTFDETGEEIYLCLAIELMGKHSNVILYNYDTNVIIGCAHNVGEDKSKVRELFGGLPYTYPPVSKNFKFEGLSDILDKTLPVNEQIDKYFADLQEKNINRNLKIKLSTIAKSKLKKTVQSIEKIKKQTKTQEKIDMYRKKGDLIMANLFANKDFEPFVEVLDYETNAPLKIELDETKTLKENANRFYMLYNKGKTALQKTKEMLEDLDLKREYFEQVLYSIEEADNLKALLEIEEEISPNKTGKEKPKEKIQIETITQLPYTIFIGKNNKQNDYIVSKLARKEDLWFHVHNCAGSHVLLRAEAGMEYTDEIIFECAKLAKKYSVAKNSKIGVIYTRAKNLKKPPKANLGYVIYKNEEEIVIG